MLFRSIISYLIKNNAMVVRVLLSGMVLLGLSLVVGWSPGSYETNPRLDAPIVLLGGEVGNAAAASAARLRFAPFNSLPWLRADLTGESVTVFDKEWDHIMNRPFKDYSGDISGRFIEIMAGDSRGNTDVHPAFKGLLDAVSKHQIGRASCRVRV